MMAQTTITGWHRISTVARDAFAFNLSTLLTRPHGLQDKHRVRTKEEWIALCFVAHSGERTTAEKPALRDSEKTGIANYR